MKFILLSVLFFYGAAESLAQTTYTWNLAGNGSWATTTNWTPTRSTPAANDILIINNGGTKTISSVPTQTIGQLIIGGNTTVTLTSTGGDRIVTINGGTGTDLDVQSGSTLQIGGTGGDYTRIAFSGVQTSTIAGTINIISNSNRDNGIVFTNSISSVSGTLRNNNGVITSTVANLIFSTTGIYRHGFTTTAGSIPIATWNSGSTCEIVAYTSNTTAPSGLAQSFHHFTWNCPSQTGSISLAGGLTMVNGNLTITTTNTAQLRLTTTTSFTLNVGGNLSLSAGNLVFSNGDNAAVTINVAGNFSQTEGIGVNQFYI